MPFTPLTSCSCETGRVSGCNRIADSLPLDVNAGEASGKAEATFSVYTWVQLIFCGNIASFGSASEDIRQS
jgi:hypothetical protein